MIPDISVIIPSYQRCESLRMVLEALCSQTTHLFEVIVSLDGSTDGSEAMLEAFTTPYTLRWINGTNGGPSAARNRGAALAKAPLLLFLDDDIIATPEMLSEHIRAQAQTTVCLGQVRVLDQRSLTPWEDYLSSRYEEHYDKLSQPGYSLTFWDCLSGNVSLSRHLFESVGGFDPEFRFTKHDDIEFGYRLAQSNAEFVYCPQALGYHRFVKDRDVGLNDAYNEGRSSYHLVLRYPELRTNLIDARLARYPAVIRNLFLSRPSMLLQDLIIGLFHVVYALRLPKRLARGSFQLAYHTRFWQGVFQEQTC
jgi:GT2 family glycosyltransferase